jgi:hypothetical protein
VGTGYEAAGFGRALGIDLCRCRVAVFEGVVLVVDFGQPFRKCEFVAVVLMNPEGELPR